MMDQDGDQKNPTKEEEEKARGGGGGWGGWGFSSLSVISDFQKAASLAAEEISRNAAAVARSAAKGIADMQAVAPESEDEAKPEASTAEGEDDAEGGGDSLRKSALDRLEKASEDSVFGQGLKVIDSSVESLASGAWSALGSAWKGGSNLVQKLEDSAVNLADSIQHVGLPAKASFVAPSIIETGKSITTKGMQVLERVGKETMEMLIMETGVELEKSQKELYQQADEQFDEVTFDRCFYIYGGPDQLEELEALSNHYALLFNRRKVKLLSEQKSIYDGKLKEVQQIFSLNSEFDANGVDLDKGKNVETADYGSGMEMNILRDSSVKKAADMAAGFAAALGGLPDIEIVQRTSDRLESVRAEGVHRLSELCCVAVSQLLMLGKSIISKANRLKSEEGEIKNMEIDWPEDSILKAKMIRSKVQSMSGDVEAVSDSFVTGISDIMDAYLAAIHSTSSETNGGLPHNLVQEKAKAISDHLCADRTTALDKIQDALQYLAYVVLSTSMPAV